MDDISVCIATYRRPTLLDALLHDLRRQRHLPRQIVVVDNDADASARAIVEQHRQTLHGVDVIYDIQQEKNISLTRNRCVAHAQAAWLAFVDDDERVGESWLADLLATAQAHGADGVLGPVISRVPNDAPAWIRQGRFFDRRRMATGQAVPKSDMRIGNALLAARWLPQDPFDPAYGQTGGEDGDLLLRLALRGARIVWCDEAQAVEDVPPSRLCTRWILARALRGGQNHARHVLGGKMGKVGLARKVVFFLRACLQTAAAAVLALLSLPFGRHAAMRWVARACANVGKLSVFLGWHYREYA
ncbi:glycosyltransferase family 2 protein [Pigmentiphaga humi]|uniref:glycosyltransferase family 2 protein n=1 Tax=Pigmentiphaga humi TaxID=2478468 RepID=UPI001FE9BD4C|nr:glycosyltransferase family 2 protein [Pigmentiphaga humi]